MIVLPDGLVKAGFTDLRGVVSEEQVAPGVADFEFVSTTPLPPVGPVRR
jgi:hypothetical protein